jgi:hypothetical protein
VDLTEVVIEKEETSEIEMNPENSETEMSIENSEIENLESSEVDSEEVEMMIEKVA